MRVIGRFVVIVLALGTFACGGRKDAVLEEGGTLEKKGDATALMEQADALWKEREDRTKAEAALAAWHQAAALDPTRADVQLRLAYGHYFLAEAHLRWAEDEEGMRASYNQGTDAGAHAIRLLSPAFAEKIKAGATWEEAIPSVEKDGVPAMYWYATNLGKWALLDGFTTVLSMKDRAFALMSRCAELDETFFNAGPHRYFGVYYTKIPFPGGDLPKSRKAFERAVELAPNYLDTKVLFAESYALKAQDKALFEKLLNEVVAAPDDINPDLVPESRNAKRKAKKLLGEVGDYF